MGFSLVLEPYLVSVLSVYTALVCLIQQKTMKKSKFKHGCEIEAVVEKLVLITLLFDVLFSSFEIVSWYL